MLIRKKCPKCGALCEYDDRSVWEGNREMEDFRCPICNYILDRIFTDQLPYVRLIETDTITDKENKGI